MSTKVAVRIRVQILVTNFCMQKFPPFKTFSCQKGPCGKTAMFVWAKNALRKSGGLRVGSGANKTTKRRGLMIHPELIDRGLIEPDEIEMLLWDSSSVGMFLLWLGII